jgi:hypothetical protein
LKATKQDERISQEIQVILNIPSPRKSPIPQTNIDRICNSIETRRRRKVAATTKDCRKGAL